MYLRADAVLRKRAHQRAAFAFESTEFNPHRIKMPGGKRTRIARQRLDERRERRQQLVVTRDQKSRRRGATCRGSASS